MLDAKCSGMYLLAAALLCGVVQVYSVTKGQKVRSSPDIPVTQFTCSGRPPGYYADLETGCQVYHMCTEGGNQFSYKCPNTTLFQQRMLICAHWYQVNCSRSEQHYGANLLIGQRDKPFVNDDTVLSKEKEVKTLHNPEALQNLGQSTREGSARQAKSQSNNKNVQANRVFQNNIKRDGESSIAFAGKPTSLPNSFQTTDTPSSNRRTQEDLSSLPLAGSVLPGGLKSFQLSHTPKKGFSINNQIFQSTTPHHLSTTSRIQFTDPATLTRQRVTHPVSFGPPTTTPNSLDRVNLFATTKSPVSFIPKFSADTSNKFQPSGFKKQQLPGNIFSQDTATAQPSVEFLPPSDQKQSPDLVVASQENALSSRLSTTTTTTTSTTTTTIGPPSFSIEEGLPDTNFKAEIQTTINGSYPDDKYNTFIKRFNPYEERSVPSESAQSEASQQEYHTFFNRFVPEKISSRPQSNLREQPEHVFINRFVLTPEEQKRSKDREQVDKLHDLLPPEDQLTVNFPNFELMPPQDDSDDSESNKIELHLQDPRTAFFIPNGDDNTFSKADAAPIIVTIPLHSHQKSPPMWFRTNESNDPCARCHPSFIVNKDTCMPCVIIR